MPIVTQTDKRTYHPSRHTGARLAVAARGTSCGSVAVGAFDSLSCPPATVAMCLGTLVLLIFYMLVAKGGESGIIDLKFFDEENSENLKKSS